MKVKELRAALMMAISQEFDHNTSQQLYVSDTLWQIIQLAKNETLNLVTNAGGNLDPEADAELLWNVLAQALEEQDPPILQRVLMAIRTEAGQLF